MEERFYTNTASASGLKSAVQGTAPVSSELEGINGRIAEINRQLCDIAARMELAVSDIYGPSPCGENSASLADKPCGRLPTISRTLDLVDEAVCRLASVSKTIGRL